MDWGRFLLKANQEVTSGEWRVARVEEKNSTTNHTKLHEREEAGLCLDKPSGAAFSNPFTSELARDSENTSPTRFASGPALAAEPPRTDHEGLLSYSAGGAEALDARRSTLGATTPPAEWYAFRLRAYEAWRDLEKFFPGEYLDLERGLEGIWKRNKFSVFSFQFLGFLLKKLGGLKQRIIGHRWPASFRCELASQTSLESLMK